MINLEKLIELSRALKPRDFTARCWHTTYAFDKGKLLAVGWNKPYTTHPRNLRLGYISRHNGRKIGHEIGTHSELVCFLRLGREDCSNLTFFNIRIDRNGQPNIAFPCSGCLNLFRQIGARKVYATNKEGKFEEVKI